MGRSFTKAPQVAAFLKADIAAHLAPAPQAEPEEPAEDGAPAIPQQFTARQRGDHLEVSGIGPSGKREVVRRIPLGKKIGNRRARREACALAQRRGS